MRLWSVPPLMLALLWIMTGVAAVHAAADPGDSFVEVLSSYKAGEKFESEGKFGDALQKFRSCVSLLEEIQKVSPDFYPPVIVNRLQKSRAAIARVQSMQQSSSSPQAIPGASAAVPQPRMASPRSNAFRFPVTYSVPISAPAAPVQVPSGEVAETVEQLMRQGAMNALKEKLETLQQEIAEKSRTIEDLKGRMLESMAREQSGQKEVDLRKVHEAEQQSQIAQLQQSLNDLEQANGLLSREKESDQRQIVGLQTDLDAARADLEVANEYNDELFAKLEQAAKFIDADEKIRAELLGERKELAAQLHGKSSNTTRIEKERDSAAARSAALQKQLDESEEAASQSRGLSKKLANAEKQLAELSKDKDRRQRIESGLRDEVASVTKTLAAMGDELKAGKKRIAELEKQLSDTADASASVTGEMADENALLKSLVTRQLKEQAKRQQARKLVEEEMEKLQIRSSSLLDKLNAMAGEEASLTPQEKKLVDQPVASLGGHSDFSLEVVKKTPASDLPPELVARASEANDLAQKREFAAAKDIYAEIAQKAPQSYLAAVNLGIAQRQLGDYPQAIAAFKRALELKRDDPFALTNLGTVQYRNGDLAGAAEVLQQAVAVDSESYLAHYLLGMTLNDQGDREGARKEVQRALYLKADYAPALQLESELRGDSSKAAPSKAAPQVAQ